MIGGVSFQPGAGASQPKATPQTGVQEAIQVLSLRLPKTVGARAIAPSALLNATGSGGNPRVDSVVNQVLARFFSAGGEGGEGAAAPMVPSMIGSMGVSGTMPVSPPVRYPDGGPSAPPSNYQPEGPFPQVGRAPRITPGDTPDGVKEPVVGASPLFPSNPQLPSYDRITGWQPPVFDTPASPSVPVERPRSLEDLFLYEPAPPQETYSI